MLCAPKGIVSMLISMYACNASPEMFFTNSPLEMKSSPIPMSSTTSVVRVTVAPSARVTYSPAAFFSTNCT